MDPARPDLGEQVSSCRALPHSLCSFFSLLYMYLYITSLMLSLFYNFCIHIYIYIYIYDINVNTLGIQAQINDRRKIRSRF
ncbi:hypothetical protein CsSME_00053262 [Camellia sinensis var. sinensis]